MDQPAERATTSFARDGNSSRISRRESLNKGFFKVLIGIAVYLFTSAVFAQAVSVRGMAAYEYNGRLDANEERAAREAATLAALAMYFASEATPAMNRIYADQKDYFTSRIDDFILSVTELSVDDNRSAKTVNVVVRAEINVPMLRAAIDGFAATTNIASAERSEIALLFMSRMQSTVQSFEDRVYSRTDSNLASNGSISSTSATNEAELITGQSISVSDSASQTIDGAISTTETSTTGGSTTRQADRVQWSVASSNELNAAMSNIFSSAGYEVVEARSIEADSNGLLSVSSVSDEFSTGNDLSAELMQSTVDGVKTAEIPYLAIGTLDVGLQDTDPVSGLIRVYVTVTGRVMDVTGRFPRAVTSVGPVQYAGLGPTETVARNNALSLAAESAAQHLVDEMNRRGVQ